MRALSRFPTLCSLLLLVGLSVPAASSATGLHALLQQPREAQQVQATTWDSTQPLVGRAYKCRDGKITAIDHFDCRNVELLAFLPADSMGGGRLFGAWGWTDSATGREFVLVGRSGPGGTSFIEITNSLRPRYLGTLPAIGSATVDVTDIKVYQHHAFIVSEGLHAGGMQIFDLTQLRAVGSVPVTFQPTAVYDRVAMSHTLAIDEATGFAYLVWTGTCGDGLHMVDIRDPVHPAFAGCYADSLVGRLKTGAVHDTQCVIYHGPDRQYRGRELCFNSAETALNIADVTDKQRPKTISIAAYPDVHFTHQGWLSEDQRYFFLFDEFDENAQMQRHGWTEERSRMIVFDVGELNDPVVVTEFFSPAPSMDHNLLVRGHYVYQAHYVGGLRIVDVRKPQRPQEVAYFNPHDRVWHTYTYFTKNADVVVCPTGGLGLFLVRYRGARR